MRRHGASGKPPRARAGFGAAPSRAMRLVPIVGQRPVAPDASNARDFGAKTHRVSRSSALHRHPDLEPAFVLHRSAAAVLLHPHAGRPARLQRRHAA